MQTVYAMNKSVALEGMTVGPNECVPLTLAWLPQITQVRFTAGDETTDVTLTVVDDASQQSYSITTTGSATEATMLDNLIAGVRANGKLNSLFSATEDGVDDLVLTARHANRSYTITCTGGPSAVTAPAVSSLQSAGGSKVDLGRIVVRGSEDGTFDAIGASAVLSDIAGVVFRTDANHFHSLESDTASAVDQLDRGKVHAVMQRGRMWVEVEEAVTPASRVYVRRALTSGAGNLGGFRDSPAGSTQVATITVVADHQVYTVSFAIALAGDLQPRKYSFSFGPTDGTTTTDVAIDGLEAAAAGCLTDNPELSGIVSASSASASATFTLTAAAGYEFADVSVVSFNEDTPAVSGTVSLAAADVDTIDISSIAQYETSASANGLALLKLKMG